MMNRRRVVITGYGAVSCVGNDVNTMWDALVNGRCGIGRVTQFDPTDFKTQVGGEVKNLDWQSVVSEKDYRRVDSFVTFALVAFDEARRDAGLPADFRGEDCAIDPNRVGVVVGSGIGGLHTIESQCAVLLNKGPSRVSPFMIPSIITNMASGMISIRCGAGGPNFSVVSACATATHAIGASFDAIADGRADMMITGGAESSITRLGYAGFCSMKAMSTHYNDTPEVASRPFDRDRDGFVMSEGAGILILEEYEHAVKRGAKIHCEVVGYGATGDAFHMTAPMTGGVGGMRAFQMALDNAGLNPEDVDYINAHGTSTHLNDLCETQAIKALFGDHARKLAISSTKGAMGHGLGAAGGFETIIASKAIETGIVPPTINYTTPDPECDLDYTPNVARERKVDVALNTNLGFGGHNGVIALRRCI